MISKLNKLKPREKLGLMVALLFVLSYLINQFVVRQVFVELRSLREQIEIEQKNLVFSRAALQTEDAVRRQFDEARDVLGPPVPVAKLIEVMKGDIDDMARKNGVDILSMEHREPRVVSALIGEYFLEVSSLEGPMKSILAFLDELQRAPGLVRVTRMNLSPTRGSDRIKGSLLITRLALTGE